MNREKIRNLIYKELLKEDAGAESVDVSTENELPGTRLAKDSVDDQIDSYLIKYESDSIMAEEDSLAESLRSLTLSGLLSEAPGDEDEEGGGEGDAPEEKPDEPAGSEDVKAEEEPPEVKKLPLDLDSFCKKIARLAGNAEYLLDTRQVVINRALNYVLDNYDQEHVDKMIEIFDTQFNFNIEDSDTPPETPYAVGAWAGGTGGLGGGGG